VAILSGWFVVTQLGFEHELRIWDVVSMRFGEGAVFLTPFLLIGRSKLPLRRWTEGPPLAVLWRVPFILLVGSGLQLTSAALASSITPALMPVFAGAIGWLFFGDRPTAVRTIGYLAIVVGLVVLAANKPTMPGTPDGIGVALLVGASAMWALYTMRLRGSGLSSLQAAALICFWSAIFFVPFFAASGLSRLTEASLGELAFQSIYQGFLMSVVALFAFNRAVMLLGPKAAAAIVALVPVTGTVFAMPVLREFPTSGGAVAIFVIATGVMLAAGSPARSESSIGT